MENKNIKYNIYKYRFSKKNIFLHGGYDPCAFILSLSLDELNQLELSLLLLLQE
jgi:hypothetical protein